MNTNKRTAKARVLRKMSDDALRLLRQAEGLQPEIFLTCDVWAMRRAIADLTWVAEYFAVMSNHLQGKALDDDNGYWNEYEWSRKMLPKQKKDPGNFKPRTLNPGETSLDRNRAEFEAATAPDGRSKRPRPNSSRKPRSKKS